MSKPIQFKTIEEAKQALLEDVLGTVQHTVNIVTVTTNKGMGIFPRKEWIKAQKET